MKTVYMLFATDVIHEGHMNVVNEAKKYGYYKDFKSKSHEAYFVARKMRWLSNYNWLIKEPVEAWNKKWNYETCYAEARKYS